MKQFFLVNITACRRFDTPALFIFFKKKIPWRRSNRPHAFFKKNKKLWLQVVRPYVRPNAYTWRRSTAPMPFFKKNKKLWRRVGPPLRPPQRVAAVGQGSYSVNLSPPTQRCHVKIAGGKFDRRSAMGAVRTAPTLGKYPPQICPFFVVS